MQITDSHHIFGTEQREGYIAIPELDRSKPSALQFIKLANLNIVLDKPTAFLYVDGFTTSQAEAGLNKCDGKYRPAVKSGSANAMHEWLYTFDNNHLVEYANIISSTCASSLQAVYEADVLLQTTNIEEVIVIGCERTTPDTVRLFKELRIPLQCGDGFFYMRLSAGTQIRDIKWKYTFHNNPFQFLPSDLDNLIPEYKIDHIKLHATGSDSNTKAEYNLSQLGNIVEYKSTIGHTQGVSALLETCMALRDPTVYEGLIMVTANGFGGFYGSFVVEK